MFLKKLWVAGAFFLTNVSYGMSVHPQTAQREESKRQALSEKSKSEGTLPVVLVKSAFVEDGQMDGQASGRSPSSTSESDSEAESKERAANKHKEELKGKKASAVIGISSSDSGSSHSRMPIPQTEPISEELQESVLRHAPKRVQYVINMWKGLDVSQKAYYKDLPKKWLLGGPAGTGKSTIGKAIAGDCGMPFFMYKTSSIATTYKDSGTGNLSKIFSEAVAINEPCMVIMDEMEVLLQKHANKSDTEAGMLPEFWMLLDQYKEHPVLVIATLNAAPEDTPDPIISRFNGHVINVDLPNKEQRKDLIRFYIKHLCHTPETDENIVSKLAKKTDGFSHRQIENLMNIARERHLKPTVGSLNLTMEDYLYALGHIKESHSFFYDKKFWAQVIRAIREWGLPIIGISMQAGLIVYQVSRDKKQDGYRAIDLKTAEQRYQDSQKQQQDGLKIQKSQAQLQARVVADADRAKVKAQFDAWGKSIGDWAAGTGR